MTTNEAINQQCEPISPEETAAAFEGIQRLLRAHEQHPTAQVPQQEEAQPNA